MNRAASGGVRPVLWALTNRLVTVVWIGALTVLILAALYVGLGRQVMANLHHYESDIEAALTQALGQPVRIGELAGQWQGLDPVIQARDLGVGEDASDASLRHLRIRLDTWASLMRQRVVFREFRASGAEATLIQQPDGRFRLEGVWQPPQSGAENQGLSDIATDALQELDAHAGQWVEQLGAVLSDPVVSLDDVRLRVEPDAGEPFPIMIPSMDVRFEHGLFSASGRMLEGHSAQRIGAFALEGRHLFSSGFTGDLYLDLDSGSTFSDLLSSYEWRGLSLESLEADAETWLGFRQGRLQRVRLSVGLPHLRLASRQGAMPAVGDLNADLLWQRTEAGWALRARGSAFDWGGRESGAFATRVERDQEGVMVAAKGLDLDMISAMGRRSGLLPEAIQQRLAAHRPSGRMERLLVRVPDSGAWRLRGTLRNVAVAADGGVPSGTGLDGYIEVGPQQGRVTLAPGPARIGFPELFHSGWRFDRLAGRVRWARRSDGWEVSAHRLVARHEGMDASGGFRLRLHEGSSDTLSLRVGIRNGDTRMLGRFVPKHQVPPDLYTFLTDSIGSGTVTEGWYYGYGDVGDDSEEGAFTSSMRYRFRDTELAYHPDWPALEGAVGSVHVQDTEGRVQLEQGTVAGVGLEPSQVRIVPAQEGIRVDVDTAARRDGTLLTEQWREDSPLADTVGDWVRELEVRGSNRMDLSLSLWPRSERQPAVDVRLALADTRVRFASAGLEWRQVAGPIRFRSWSGFSDTELEGRFMGEPVALQVRDAPDQVPVFRQQGTLSVARLEEWLSRSLPRINGKLDYDAAFRPTDGPSLRLDANLAEVALDWPAPLAKETGEEHSLTATMDFEGDGGEAIRIEGNWYPLGAFRFVLRDGVMERGRVGLGVRATDLPDDPVFSITGALPGLPMKQWWQALEDIPIQPDVVHAGQVSRAGSALLPPLEVRLGISEPRLNGNALSPVQVEARAEPAGDWRVALESEWIQGTMADDGDQGLSVDLEHLVLPELGEGGSSEDSVPRLDSVTMARGARNWPEARVRVGRLVLGQRRITDLSLTLLPDGTRVRLDPLAFTMGDLALDGSLSWQPTRESGVTEFSGSLSGSDLRGLEALLGETTVPVSNERTEASLNLAWPGGPSDFSLSRLRAAMDFRLEDGIIDQDIEGARVFRVFGLLNTDTLWRRLQLDFSDVYESGIPFDHIEGEALIHEGRLIFDPAVVIQAPSGGFRMSGEADLISENLDMRLVVVLPVTQNLPLAAVLFGYAPPIGGALFVIDKVFGGILSRVTSATYTVEGNWNDPDIELRNLFDTESDLDSYERPEVGVEAPERPGGEIRR